MLIRSQDKTAIINVDNAFNTAVRDINGTIVIQIGNSSSCCIIAEYSTKEKAIKVLDMIQKAYAKYQTIHTSAMGLATMSLFTESTNEVNEPYMKAQDILEKVVAFQMPEDSEVPDD